MITIEIINRINELARKKRLCGLTEQEIIEQADLRRIYIENIKQQIKNHLEPFASSQQPSEVNEANNGQPRNR